jgi:hypothetical protein
MLAILVGGLALLATSVQAQFSNQPPYRTRVELGTSYIWADGTPYSPETAMYFTGTMPFFIKEGGFMVADAYALGDVSGQGQHQFGGALSGRMGDPLERSGYGASLYWDAVRLTPDFTVNQLVLGAYKLTENRNYIFNYYVPDQSSATDGETLYQLLPGFDITLSVWQPISLKASVYTNFAYQYFEKTERDVYQGPHFSLSFESYKKGYNRFVTFSTLYDTLHGPSVGIGLSFVKTVRGETNALFASSSGLDRRVYRNPRAFVYSEVIA